MDAPKLTMTPDEALLKQLQALEQVAEAGKQMAAIYAEIARRGGTTLASGSVAVKAVVRPAADTDIDISNVPLMDAVLSDLKASKKPKTIRQIWHTLDAAGYEPHSDNPEDAVKYALKKLAGKNPDVVHIGGTQWHHRCHYKQKARLDRLIARFHGRGGRTTDEHVARTLEGMEKAKARGKIGHRPSKVTPEIATKLKEAMLSGATQKAIAAAGGISVSMFNYYKPKLDGWNIGESWPPEAKPASEEQPAPAEPPLFRLVKS